MKKIITCTFIFLFLPLLAVLFFSNNGLALTLVNSGKSDYTIVLGKDASPSEIHGANELQMFLQMISKVSIPIRRENENISGPMIFVGNSTKLNSIDNSINFKSFGDEGFIIKNVREHLILAGGKLRGTMYAVYTFLEEELGCRWYTSKVSKIPSISTITIGDVFKTQSPVFEYREPYWKDAFNPDWAARNKCNGNSAALDRQRGGKILGNGGHTFYPYMPPDKYFNDHPEWYSIFSNRKRQWENGQLCLTNPEVQKVMTHQVKNDMSRSPERNTFPVGQNDWYGYCECSHCKNVDDYEGAQSGTVMNFVNAIAERTKKNFPQNRIMTFAYQYTEKPPQHVKPINNVIIDLCDMHGDGQGCDAHPLERCELNKKFVENLKNWSRIADKIYIWDYVTNFNNYLVPIPIWKTNKEDLLFFKNYGVDGVFEQATHSGSGRGCSEIMAYVEAKLLWNPNRNVDEIVNDFITGYYGPAAEPMKEFHRLLEDRVMKDWCHFTMWSPVTNEMFSPEFLSKANEILDKADRAAASDHDAAFRVEEARLMIQYVELAKPVPHVIENGFYKPAPDAPEFSTLRNVYEFINKCKKHNVEELSHGRAYYQRLRPIMANLGSHPVLTLENAFLKIELIPGIGGKIYQITDKRTGKSILRIGSPTEFPMAGGMRESPNEAENCSYQIETTAEGQKITLESYVWIEGHENAMILKREIFVPKDKPEIHCNSSLEALVNIALTRISPNMELVIGNSSDISVGFADVSGRFRIEPLTFAKDERGNLNKSYRTREITSGKWCIVNKTDNIALISEFKPEQVEVCSISQNTSVDIMVTVRSNFAIKDKSLSLGIRSLPKPLKTGEKLFLSYKFILTDPLKVERY